MFNLELIKIYANKKTGAAKVLNWLPVFWRRIINGTDIWQLQRTRKESAT
jgi:hypothetical protein